MKFAYFATPLILLTALAPTLSRAGDIDDVGLSSLFFEIGPLREEVNLTPAFGSTIPAAGDGYGYAVRLQKKAYLVVGAVGDLHLPAALASLWTNVGLYPTYDGLAVFTGHVKTEAELDQFDRDLPRVAMDALSWQPGDRGFVRSEGGVATYLAEGLPNLNLAELAIVTGGWQTLIERKAGTRVYVEHRPAGTSNVSAMVGNQTINLGEGVISHLAQGLAFEFDLSQPKAAQAYEDFLGGNALTAQAMASNSQGAPVSSAGTLDYKTETDYSEFTAGVPFLPIGVTNTSDDVEMRIEDRTMPSGVTSKAYVATYMSDLQCQFFFNQSERSYGFRATVTDTQIRTASSEHLVLGRFFYAKEANDDDAGDISDSIQSLADRTGLGDLFGVGVADYGDSSYARVSFTMSLPESYPRYLIAHPEILEQIRTEALGSLQPHEFLPGEEHDAKTVEANRVQSDVNDLAQAVADMKASIDQDPESFAHAYAVFGKAAWDSPRVFRAVFDSAEPCGMVYRFEVAGRKIAHYVKTNQASISDQCFDPVY